MINLITYEKWRYVVEFQYFCNSKIGCLKNWLRNKWHQAKPGVDAKWSHSPARWLRMLELEQPCWGAETPKQGQRGPFLGPGLTSELQAAALGSPDAHIHQNTTLTRSICTLTGASRAVFAAAAARPSRACPLLNLLYQQVP